MKYVMAVAMLVGLAAAAGAQAQAPAYTAIVLDDIHCMGCAKKISAKVTAVPGVAEMRVDLKAKTVWAIHKQGATPSPKALWEAVESADHTPTKMQTPTGTHTSKPQS